MMKTLQSIIVALSIVALSPSVMAACSDPAGPGVDWSLCDKSAANYRTGLFNANLSGADLQGTNLSGQALKLADLSNANLTNADTTDADLSDAKLGGTTKPDGSVCPEGSVDFC